MKKFLIFIVMAILGYFYTSSSIKISYDFYHWTSVYKVESNEKKSPKYIKVLDISFTKTLLFRKTLFHVFPSEKIVPVIYIDNPLWNKMRAKSMVKKVLNALMKMPLKNYSEIQVDCDWTDGSKERYFEFLKLLKEQSAKNISVTIRLHQVKYHNKTGVPPVDYGILMYYNMSDFRDIETKNYILDLGLAKQYHYNFDTYPLALNLALPLYSQATIMRFSKVVGLIEGVREKELNKNFTKLKEHLYEVTKTHYFQERLLYEGDKIRVDEVSFEMLQKSIKSLSDTMRQPKEIIFYRWGNSSHYEAKKLKDIVESW
jgi:hypothetical protein